MIIDGEHLKQQLVPDVLCKHILPVTTVGRYFKKCVCLDMETTCVQLSFPHPLCTLKTPDLLRGG